MMHHRTYGVLHTVECGICSKSSSSGSTRNTYVVMVRRVCSTRGGRSWLIKVDGSKADSCLSVTKSWVEIRMLALDTE